jgi:hypothetical protein
VDSGNPRAWRGGTIPRRTRYRNIIPLAGKGEGNFWGSLKFPEDVPPASPVEILHPKNIRDSQRQGGANMEVYRHVISWMEEIKREDICVFEKDPVLWSEETIAETLQRQGAQIAGLQDLRSFIRAYLNVVCDVTRKAEAH